MDKYQEIVDGKNILLCSDETIQRCKTPIGKSLLSGRPKKTDDEKTKYSDRVECNICGKIFTRSNRSAHNKTQYHIMYGKAHDKLKAILLS